MGFKSDSEIAISFLDFSKSNLAICISGLFCLDKAIASIGAFIAATTILHGQALAALTKALILVPLQSFISSLGLAAIGQKAFASATGMATAQVRIFNVAMNKNLIILGATALVAAGSAVWHFGRQWQRTVDEIEKGKMPLNDARIKVAELEKELKGESNEKLRLRLQTQIDMYKEAIETRMELVKAAELAEAESFKNASAKPDEGKWATLKEYEDIAIELANNPSRLKEIKNKLEKNKLEQPLFNTKLFAKHIESAYAEMHKKYINNEKRSPKKHKSNSNWRRSSWYLMRISFSKIWLERYYSIRERSTHIWNYLACSWSCRSTWCISNYHKIKKVFS